MEAIVAVEDYEPLAREHLPPEVFDFVSGGAGDEWTLRENARAFERLTLRPRVLRGVGDPDTSTEILGTPLSVPVLVAPWGYQRLVHPEGESATARAAARAGTVMAVPTSAEENLETIARASDGPKWWQLYIFSDREFTAEMLRRAEAAGYEAVLFTVDLQIKGIRYRDLRNTFEMPERLRPRGGPYEPAIDWADLAWVREQTGLPVLVKGILRGDDAELAVEAGADGIVVSNHGGRQLDGVAAGIDALPEVVAAVQGRVPVLVDGGVRRGTDVVKAIAVGAAAVLIARPAAWGLAVDGEDGVYRVLEILRDELRVAMTLAGCASIEDITADLVRRR